ncbi:MAG: hypothetical protein RL329_1229 [Bacteroidota bacterium]|jgi:glycine/D-amino acid oxidase-like deaminating enzyme
MKKKSTITIVGAGIVNLISAYFLSKQGHQITIIDKAKNPFLAKRWQQQGATFGGENARMFSITEADNYNEKKSVIYKDMAHLFETNVQNDGWSVLSTPTAAEAEWIQQFKSVDAADAYRFADEIYGFTIQSGALWDDLIQKEPCLFENTHLKHDIVRLYSAVSDFQAAQRLHKRLGSFIEVLTSNQLAHFYPEGNKIAVQKSLGGVMKVKGFTLQIHDFCQNLISYLEKKGVVFHWEQSFSGIEKNRDGEVVGLKVGNQCLISDYNVLSLGAYSGNLFHNTLSHNKIHGVLGIWMTLPNVYGLEHSFKIHKDGHVGEDSNVTVVEEKGKQQLVFGAGYGYVGNVTQNTVDLNQLKPIYDSLWQTAKTYFPEAYEQGVADGLLAQPQKYCTRPFTTTGLGIFESISNENGGATFLTGGHNTGGFTQAPIVAKTLVEIINGKKALMPNKYHPMRGWVAQNMEII